MRASRWSALVGLVVGVASVPLAVSAQGTLAASGAEFVVNDFGGGETTWDVDFSSDTGNDQQYAVGFYHRIGAATEETPLSVPSTQSFVGNVMTVTYANVGGAGVNVTIIGTLSAPAAGAATMAYSIAVSNTTASAITLQLFGIVDFDLDGDADFDSATLMTGLPNPVIVVSDTTTMTLSGSSVTHYEVSIYPSLTDAMDDAVATTLGDAGLPFGPDDFTAGLQWTLNVPAGSTVTRGMSTAIVEPPEVCGDGRATGAEFCDDGYTDACGSCNADCTDFGLGAACGDGMVCPESETCDDGYADDCGTCNSTCDGPGSPSACGDGVRCAETEVCDDGYTDACGSCNATCDGAGAGATCGDGTICPETEMCDDGFADACGTCNATCTAPGTAAVCGDGMVCMESETCDDGFTDACGTCNETCDGAGAGSTCGDGNVCAETEACDDGNTSDGDGCSMSCAMESDAGPMPGTDAGPIVGTDAGPMAGTDGGRRDGGGGGSDGGVGADAGSGDDGGCSCRVHAGSRSGRWWLALGLLGLAVVRRRRA